MKPHHLLPVLGLVLAVLPAAAEPLRVLAFGDSITRGYGDPGVDCDTPVGGYPARLATLLESAGRDVEVINLGLCGETTFEGVSRIDGELSAGGDVVIIMEGTNDLSTFTPLASMRFNVREMARKAEERGLVPIILSVIPRGPDSGRDSNNERTAAFAGWLAYEAQQDGRLFADPFTALITIPDLFDRFYFDPWHVNAEGYDRLTEVILEPALEATEPPFGLSCPSPAAEPAAPCTAEEGALCLAGGRFRVDVAWQDFAGERGTGKALPLTDNTGSFWFFDPANVELIVKVLDGRPANGHFWVFYGALSNVAYSLRVTDLASGNCKVYNNPLGHFGSTGDTVAFAAPDDEPGAGEPGEDEPDEPGEDEPGEDEPGEDEPDEPGEDEPEGGGGEGDGAVAASEQTAEPPVPTCTGDATSLCLVGRFRVAITWSDSRDRSGPGQPVPLSDDTGVFWFFRPQNLEVVVKVLDGRPANGHFWVFYGALSNLAYSLEVTDTVTGAVKVYDNPRGTFASAGDVEAFAGASGEEPSGPPEP